MCPCFQPRISGANRQRPERRCQQPAGATLPLAPSLAGLTFTHKSGGVKGKPGGGNIAETLPATPEHRDTRRAIVFAS